MSEHVAKKRKQRNDGRVQAYACGGDGGWCVCGVVFVCVCEWCAGGEARLRGFASVFKRVWVCLNVVRACAVGCRRMWR
jgi:hypothetical protein